MSTATPDPYIRNATVLDVHDGDTVTLDVDLGYFAHAHVPHRLLGINAPELSTAEGKASRDYLAGELPVGTKVVVHSKKDNAPIEADKYGGRFLGDLFRQSDNLHINADMVLSGHAKAWDGKGVKPV